MSICSALVRTVLVAVVVVLGTSGIVTPGVVPIVPSGGATMMFCAHGGVSFEPIPTPSGFESEFAEVVIAINSAKPIANVSVSKFELLGSKGTVSKLKRVASIGRFVDLPPPPDWGSFAYYMRPEMSDSAYGWDGTLPRGLFLLRVRMSVVPVAGDEEVTRCRIELGPYTVEGPLDGEWST